MRLNLRRLRLDVEETGPRQVRVERARDAKTKVEFELTEQKEKLQALEAVRDDNTAPRATAAVLCADAAPVAGTQRLPVVFFDQFRNYYSKQGQAACVDRQQRAAAKLSDERQGFLKEARAALLQPRTTTSECTALLPVVEHALSGPGKHVMVLMSDAAETCSRANRPVQFGGDAQALLVLVPSVGPISERGPEALDRAVAWQRLVPSLTVLPFQDLPAWRWPDLAGASSRATQ